MLGFRTRNPLRDRQTDETRLERLRRTLTDITGELEKEKAGFQARYERASTDAAFSQQALEDGRSDESISIRIDELTASLITYSNRIATLDRQLAFMAQLDVEITEFAVAEAAARDAMP